MINYILNKTLIQFPSYNLNTIYGKRLVRLTLNYSEDIDNINDKMLTIPFFSGCSIRSHHCIAYVLNGG